MLNIIITLICALFFLLSGSLIQFVKRVFQVLVTIILKLLNFLGIKIDKSEDKIKVSKEFNQTFQDIRIVKKSKKNDKIKPSINIVSLIIFIISLLLIIINLNAVSGNAVSQWLYSLNINGDKIANKLFIMSQKDMDITFTAIMFSIVSFSSSKLLSQWKETSKFRQAKKEIKLKQSVVELMTSKELLDAAKNKDIQHYNALKKENDKNV